jgi:hypothetical protein
MPSVIENSGCLALKMLSKTERARKTAVLYMSEPEMPQNKPI